MGRPRSVSNEACENKTKFDYRLARYCITTARYCITTARYCITTAHFLVCYHLHFSIQLRIFHINPSLVATMTRDDRFSIFR